MDRRDMRRTDWRRILKRRYVARPARFAGLSGVAGLIAIDAVDRPLAVRSGGEDVVIADAGYTWLQFAPRDRRFWLTAMFAPDGDLLQLYFDITAGNRFDDPDNPTFLDLYLDIVVTGRREILVLDRDELDAALARGRICAAEHARAVDECHALQDALSRHMDAVLERCREERRELLKLLPRA